MRRPLLVLILPRQGALLRFLGRLLHPCGILLTSPEEPRGEFSQVPIGVYYRSLESLDRFLQESLTLPRFPGRFSIGALNEECSIRFQRQRFLSAFTDEWNFARMVAAAYPRARRLDFTIANPALRSFRIWTAARRQAFKSLLKILQGLWRGFLLGRRDPVASLRPRVVWGGISPVEMQEDPGRISLPQFLRQTAAPLQLREEEIWLVGYGPLSSHPPTPQKILPPAPPGEMFRFLWEALLGWLHVIRQIPPPLSSLAVAESALVSWARYWLDLWKPTGVIGTLGEVGCDSHYVIAARLCKIPACQVSYASLNVQGHRWDDLEPGFRYLLFTHYLVWGETLVSLLKPYISSDAQILVSGPVMFALGPSGMEQNGDRFRVGVFDVSPVSGKLLASLGLGKGWYSLEEVALFYREILEALSALPFECEMVIKPKRPLDHPQVMPGYPGLLSQLQRHPKVRVHLCPASANPWRLLASLDACISIPFTSMTSAALRMGIPSVFYAVSSEIVPGRYNLDGDRLIRGKAALSAWLQEVYRNGRAERRFYNPSEQLASALAQVMDGSVPLKEVLQ